jgi:hypothetical protein
MSEATQTLAIRELLPDSVDVVGALAFDERPHGISPRRLPDWTRLQMPQPMDVMVRMPSGVRLRFATDSSRVGLSFHATNLLTPPAARRPISFSLESGGRLQHAASNAGNTLVLNRSRPGEFELIRGEPDTVWFEDLPPGPSHCELWLPHNAFIELRSLHIDAASEVSAAEPDQRLNWVHYGSSISHCMEADRPRGTWPAIAAQRAGVELFSLGLAGQCHLDGFVARTIAALDADFISAKVGINVVNADSLKERTFVPALHAFLDTIRERKPATPILLVSPIHCPVAEDRVGPTVRQGTQYACVDAPPEARPGSLTLRRIREIVANVVERRRALGDANLYGLDGLALFGEADVADLPDLLHPNAAGYARMGERFAAAAFAPGGAFAKPT